MCRYWTICDPLSLGPSSSPARQIQWVSQPSDHVSNVHNFVPLFSISLVSDFFYKFIQVIHFSCDLSQLQTGPCNIRRDVFSEFRWQVKHWITFNEPHTVATQAYDLGVHAPGRCSSRLSCKAGNSSTEPYIVAHHIILSHTTAADIYRRKYTLRWNEGTSNTASFSSTKPELGTRKRGYWAIPVTVCLLTLLGPFAVKTEWISWGLIWCYVVWTRNKLHRRHWSSSRSPRFSAWLVTIKRLWGFIYLFKRSSIFFLVVFLVTEGIRHTFWPGYTHLNPFSTPKLKLWPVS